MPMLHVIHVAHFFVRLLQLRFQAASRGVNINLGDFFFFSPLNARPFIATGTKTIERAKRVYYVSQNVQHCLSGAVTASRAESSNLDSIYKLATVTDTLRR